MGTMKKRWSKFFVITKTKATAKIFKPMNRKVTPIIMGGRVIAMNRGSLDFISSNEPIKPAQRTEPV
jgi:hypothetical protein